MSYFFCYEKAMSGGWQSKLYPSDPRLMPAYNGKEMIPTRSQVWEIPIASVSDYNIVMRNLEEMHPKPESKP